eukprot:g70521.t1
MTDLLDRDDHKDQKNRRLNNPSVQDQTSFPPLDHFIDGVLTVSSFPLHDHFIDGVLSPSVTHAKQDQNSFPPLDHFIDGVLSSFPLHDHFIDGVLSPLPPITGAPNMDKHEKDQHFPSKLELPLHVDSTDADLAHYSVLQCSLQSLGIKDDTKFFAGPDGRLLGEEGIRAFARGALPEAGQLTFPGHGGISACECANLLAMMKILSDFLETNQTSLLLLEDDVQPNQDDNSNAFQVLQAARKEIAAGRFDIIWMEHFLTPLQIETIGIGRLKTLNVTAAHVLATAYKHINLPISHILAFVLQESQDNTMVLGMADLPVFVQLRNKFPSVVHGASQEAFIMLHQAEESIESPCTRLQRATLCRYLVFARANTHCFPEHCLGSFLAIHLFEMDARTSYQLDQTEAYSHALTALSRLSAPVAIEYSNFVRVYEQQKVHQGSPCIRVKAMQTHPSRRRPFESDGRNTAATSGWDVTLVSQGTADKLTAVRQTCGRWRGQISFALFAQTEEDASLAERKAREAFNGCLGDVTMKLCVGAPDQAYPINPLRNLAIAQVRTSHFLLVDADLVPSVGLYDAIVSQDNDMILADPYSALVVPTFEQLDDEVQSAVAAVPERGQKNSLNKTLQSPPDIVSLHNCMQAQKCQVFKERIAAGHGHVETNSHVWLKAHVQRHTIGGSSYPRLTIACFLSDLYEPYVVLRREASTPRFEANFQGYGRNKIQFIQHLRLSGFVFSVLPQPEFLTHMPHPESASRKAWSTTWMTNEILFSEFMQKLHSRTNISDSMFKGMTRALYCDLRLDVDRSQHSTVHERACAKSKLM